MSKLCSLSFYLIGVNCPEIQLLSRTVWVEIVKFGKLHEMSFCIGKTSFNICAVSTYISNLLYIYNHLIYMCKIKKDNRWSVKLESVSLLHFHQMATALICDVAETHPRVLYTVPLIFC